MLTGPRSANVKRGPGQILDHLTANDLAVAQSHPIGGRIVLRDRLRGTRLPQCQRDEDSREEGESGVLTGALTDSPVIEGLLKSITEREAQVLRLRYGLYSGTAMTLDEIGKKLNLTRERVRQIQKAALRKLQEKMILAAKE